MEARARIGKSLLQNAGVKVVQIEDPLAPEPTEVPANVDAETGEIIEEVSE